MGQKCRVPSNKILRWYLIIPTTYKQNSSPPLQQKMLPGISLASKQEMKQLYTVSPFQSYRDRAQYFSFTLTSYMWGICFGIILTDRQVLEQWYFQRAHGHKCHSVNSQCAASMCRCRPENASARRERRDTEKHSKSDKIKSNRWCRTTYLVRTLYLSYFKVGDLVSIMFALFEAKWRKISMDAVHNRM